MGELKLKSTEWDLGPWSLAKELSQMLQAVIDEGTHIDSGGGDAVADLWPTIGGREYHIHIKVERD